MESGKITFFCSALCGLSLGQWSSRGWGRGAEESTNPVSFLSGYAYICVYMWVGVHVEARSLKPLV